MDRAVAEDAAARAAGEGGRRGPRLLPALIVATTLSTLAAAGLLTVRTTASLEQARILAMENHRVGTLTNGLMLAIERAEAGERAFLLTHRQNYLEPYWRAEAETADLLDALDAMGNQLPWLTHEVRVLRSLCRIKLQGMERLIQLDREQGHAAAVAALAEGDSHDEILASVDRLATRADAERIRLTAAFRHEQDLAWRSVLIAASALVLLLGGSAAGWVRSRARQRRAQLGAQMLAARLQAAADHIRDGVAVFDAEDRLVLWNRAFFPTAGLPEMLGRNGISYADVALATMDWEPPLLADFQPPEINPAMGEMRRDHRVLEVWRSAMPDGGQILALADITRRSQAEELARQAERSELLGQMTGGVAHDFNNLLQVVSANLELIGTRLPADSWLQSRLSAALGAVERGARLTRQLLAFARRQKLAPEVIDVRALLTGMEDMIRRTVGEQIAVHLVISPGLWPVLVDAQQLENGLLNLVVNARDAMPRGGTLCVIAANRGVEAAETAGRETLAAGDYVEIAVTDDGIGMMPEQRERAIEPFYTTKPEGKGTGLGLSMVYGFVKQSGGDLSIESTVGQGTTVRLMIPRTQGQPATDAGRPDEAPRGMGETILLVEDDPSVLTSAANALRGLGYRVLEAANGAKALRMLEEGLRPDLLFSDVITPGPVSAGGLAERARALVPGLVVVFTSGLPDHPVMPRDGVADIRLLGKPWRIDELARTLREALDEQKAASQAEAWKAGDEPPLRILLTEDQAILRVITAETLGQLGHDVVEAADAAETLSRSTDGIDLLITDLSLPDMDGIALAEAIRRKRPDIGVIIATGHLVQSEQARDDMVWLAKPFDTAALMQAIQQALAAVARAGQPLAS
ncbi:MAG TPA: response regulator [Acetobacteraceae bacterium]|nr:response regulator [Acetobacteraceae bacterium]